MIEVIAKALYDSEAQWCPYNEAAHEQLKPYRNTASIALDALREAGYVVIYQPGVMMGDFHGGDGK
jgi:hypothetical protein